MSQISSFIMEISNCSRRFTTFEARRIPLFFLKKLIWVFWQIFAPPFFFVCKVALIHRCQKQALLLFNFFYWLVLYHKLNEPLLIKDTCLYLTKYYHSNYNVPFYWFCWLPISSIIYIYFNYVISLRMGSFRSENDISVSKKCVVKKCTMYSLQPVGTQV